MPTPDVPDCNQTDTGDDPRVLNGVYQIDWSYEALAEATGLTRQVVEDNDGLLTTTFSDGCFNAVWADFDDGSHCAGAYTVTGNRISLVASLVRDDWVCGDHLLGQEFLNAAWELTEDELILSDFTPSERWNEANNVMIPAYFGTKPLHRVGGADGTTP